MRYSDIDGVDVCDSNSETTLPRCGTLLAGQPMRDSGLRDLFFVANGEALDNTEVFGTQPFHTRIFDYDITTSYTKTIRLRPYTINGFATISITKAGDDTDYFQNKSSGDTSDEITLATDGSPNTLKIIVEDTMSTTYTFTVRREPFSINNVAGDEVNKINEGEELTLTAEVLGEIEDYMYSWQQEDLRINTAPSSTAALTVRIPEDFIVGSDVVAQDIAFTLRFIDEASVSSATRIVDYRESSKR